MEDVAMSKDTMQPLAVKLRDAARLLNLSARTVWDLVQRGEIPVRVIKNNHRRTYLFSVAELERWARGDRAAASPQQSEEG